MGFEPMNQKGRDLKPRAFDRFATRVICFPKYVAGSFFFIKIVIIFNLKKSKIAVWNPKYINIIIIYKKVKWLMDK